MTHIQRITTIHLVRIDSPGLFSSRAWRVSIDDEGAGEFLDVTDGEGNSISIDPDEWPALRAAIDEMAARIVNHEGDAA